MHDTMRQEINGVDWSKYDGQEGYNADEVPIALCALLTLRDRELAEATGNRLLSAVGNNHQGVYFPAAVEAVRFLIEIEQTSDSDVSRNCARALLNDLYYFEPYVGENRLYSETSLRLAVMDQLGPYSDERY